MKTQTLTAGFALGFVAWVSVSTLCWSTVPCATMTLTATACVGCSLAAICLINLFPGKWRTGFVAVLILCAGVFEAVYGLCQLSGIAASGHYRYLVTGTYANPGPYGGFLAVCASVALCLCKRHENKWLCGAAALMCIMLVASMSRAAMAALLACVCIQWREEIWKNIKWVLPLAVILAISLYAMKAGSANGRLFMMLMGCEAWKEALWLGHGPGAFLHALSLAEIDWFSAHPDSMLADWAGVAEYAFCEPLKIAVEYGVVGFVLFAGMIVSALASLWKKESPVFYGLLGLCVFSVFSYPFSLWPFQLVLAVFMAEAITQAHVRAGASSIVSGVIGVGLIAGATVMLNPYRKARQEYAEYGNMQHAAFIEDNYRLLPLMLEDRSFLFAFAQMLRDEGRYNDSNDMLRRCGAISNDPMIYVLTGRNYEDLGAYDLAEQRYLDAYHMQPNRLYPLYRLMMMHRDLGDTARCIEYAGEVARFKPKIQSPATKDMQMQAEEIIRGANH